MSLFGQVLGLCAKAGLVRSGVVAIDGTKLHANASRDSNLDYDGIAREIIAEAIAIDEAEDELYGDARGDELPPELRTEEGRREWLARALEQERAAEREQQPEASGRQGGAGGDTSSMPSGSWRGSRAARGGCGRPSASSRRIGGAQAEPVPRSRSERLRDAGRRLEEDLAAERRGNEAYEDVSRARADEGRPAVRGPTEAVSPPASPQGEVNLTDPDSRVMKAFRGYVQGYNAQAAVNEQQIVLAAEITVESVDFSHLGPMVDATLRELEQAGISDKPQTALADAGYWNEQHMDDVIAEHGIQVLIPPDSSRRKGERPGWTGGRYTFMRRVLETEPGEELYRKRKQTVEPVFGHTKHNRKFNRFHRRGRTAVRTEWRLLMMTHNLTKLHRHQIATVAA